MQLNGNGSCFYHGMAYHFPELGSTASEWRVRLGGMPDDDVWAHETAESRAIEFEIHEGDMLLVPRGWAHAVQSRDNFSASVNWFYECDTVEEYEDKIPDEL